MNTSNLYLHKEIVRDSTIRNFRIVQKEGGREITRNIEFYNLEAIIAVGFRVNSRARHPIPEMGRKCTEGLRYSRLRARL